jgi:hypothetical protein
MKATSTVGMPVTRHPPCSPGRAVVPPPVPRLSSRPRCKAVPSGTHSPTWNRRHTRTRSLDAVAHVGNLLPRSTPPLAAPPMEPCERTVHRPMEEAVQRAGVPAPAILVVMASSSRMQPLEECPPRQGPVWLHPFREPVAGAVELLTGGASPAAGHAVPLWPPEERASQQGDAPLRAGVHTAAPVQMRLLRRHLEVALRSPLREPPQKPFRVLLPAEGTHPGLGISTPQGCTPTGGGHHLLKPDVQGIGQLPRGEDGGERAAVRRPRRGRDDLASRGEHPCLQPWTNQVEKGPGVDPLAHHVPQPRLLHGGQAAVARSLSQGALPSVLAGQGEGADRLPHPPSAAIAVPALENIRRREGRQPLCAGPWHQLGFQRGHASGPCRAVGVRHGTASDQLGPVARRFPSLSHGLDVVVQIACIGVCRALVHPPGRLLMQGLPAGAAQRRLQASVQFPQPGSRVGFGFVGSPPQGGGLLRRRSDGVRQEWPGRATSCWHVLPLGGGFPHRRGRGVIRRPRRIQRAFPRTVLLRLPGACALGELRVQPCSGAAFPLPCRRSCLPSAPPFHAQAGLGPPTCFDASLPACRGRRTPADRPLLAMSLGSCGLRERSNPRHPP